MSLCLSSIGCSSVVISRCASLSPPSTGSSSVTIFRFVCPLLSPFDWIQFCHGFEVSLLVDSVPSWFRGLSPFFATFLLDPDPSRFRGLSPFVSLLLDLVCLWFLCPSNSLADQIQIHHNLEACLYFVPYLVWT